MKVLRRIEVWLPVPGYEGLYDISSHGRVMSVQRKMRRTAKVLKQTVTKGYPEVVLYRNGKQKTHKVHKLVALAFLGPCPDDLEVRHLDGNKQNPYVGNLQYGTKSENALDSVKHGVHPQSKKTHCPQKHEYTEANTYWYMGQRGCRVCRRDRMVSWKAKHKKPKELYANRWDD